MALRYDKGKLDEGILKFLESRETPHDPRYFGTWKVEIETDCNPRLFVNEYLKGDGRVTTEGRVITFYPLAKLLELTLLDPPVLKYVRKFE